jgi:hypothetical protein
MSSFSLRKLEMAFPHLQAAEKREPKALVNLAAIAMADEASLKLSAAGNTEALQVYIDKAYDMESDEVAALLAVFIKGSQRFTLVLSGLKPEEVNQHLAYQEKTLKESLGIQSEEV